MRKGLAGAGGGPLPKEFLLWLWGSLKVWCLFPQRTPSLWDLFIILGVCRDAGEAGIGFVSFSFSLLKAVEDMEDIKGLEWGACQTCTREAEAGGWQEFEACLGDVQDCLRNKYKRQTESARLSLLWFQDLQLTNSSGLQGQPWLSWSSTTLADSLEAGHSRVWLVSDGDGEETVFSVTRTRNWTNNIPSGYISPGGPDFRLRDLSLSSITKWCELVHVCVVWIENSGNRPL